MKDHEAPFEDTMPTPAEIAGWRWRAIEAANSAPDLSPLARRVLTALLCMMDNDTRECFPSELRIAETLGVHEVSVKKAKAELRDRHRLIHWTNPGGPRHQSHYIFNWERLIRLSDEAKDRGKVAVASRRAKKTANGSQAATMGTQRNGSRMTTLEAASDNSIVAVSLPHSSQTAPQGSRFATPIVAARLPEQPLRTASIRTASSEHDVRSSQRAAAATPPVAALMLPISSVPVAGQEEALERPVRSPPRHPACCFPAIEKEFGQSKPIMDLIRGLSFDHQSKIAKALATKGLEAARIAIEEAVGKQA